MKNRLLLSLILVVACSSTPTDPEYERFKFNQSPCADSVARAFSGNVTVQNYGDRIFVELIPYTFTIFSSNRAESEGTLRPFLSSNIMRGVYKFNVNANECKVSFSPLINR